jgi:hypothetical protein
MSDETSNSSQVTEWEAEGFQNTIDSIVYAAGPFNEGVEIGVVRGYLGDQPVAVVILSDPSDQTDPDHVITTPVAVLLLGDVVDLVTFPEARVLANPDYVPAPAGV